MIGKVRHRLLELIHAKELELGRRVTVSEIAEGSGVSERLVYRWLDPDDTVKRFDEPALSGFCGYFKVGIEDLLVYEAGEDNGLQQASDIA